MAVLLSIIGLAACTTTNEPTHTAAAVNPNAGIVLDVGCGAGNYTLKLRKYLPDFDVTLVDLSQPMLDKAVERVAAANAGIITSHQSDIRHLNLGENQFDIILAAAVLHHLRGDDEWQAVFAKFYRALKTGGSLWISDLIIHDTPAVNDLMWRRYGDYLTNLKDESYRDHVFAYIDKEDSPRSLNFQLNLLSEVGFGQVEILHKNSNFAAFGAIK